MIARTGPSRRFVLAAPAVAALLGGCTDNSARNSATPLKASPSASPGAALRAEAGRDSVGLLAEYDVVIAAYPALADGLKPLRAEVARHAKAFGATAAAPTPSPQPPPGTEKTALAALVEAEKSLADARTTALLDTPPELARLLASVAAAGAGHVLLLQEG